MAQCLLTINFQQLLCTVMKNHVTREAKKLYCSLCETFSLIYSLLTAKCIDLSLFIDHSTYFKDVIQYYMYYCQVSPVSA